MDSLSAHAASSEKDIYVLLGRKSWVAYIWLFIKFSAGIALSLNVLVFFSEENRSTAIAIIIYSIVAAWFIYRVLVIRSFRIYMDKAGVWYFLGILPWTKVTIGLNWNDSGLALFYPGFFSWLTKSYRITLIHKYTKTGSIQCTHIWRGNDVIFRINEERNRYFG